MSAYFHQQLAFDREIDTFPSRVCLEGFQWSYVYNRTSDSVVFELHADVANDEGWFVDADYSSTFGTRRKVRLSGDVVKFSIPTNGVANGSIGITITDFRGVTSCCYDYSSKNKHSDFVLIAEDERFHIESGVLTTFSSFFRVLVQQKIASGKRQATVENVAKNHFRDFLNIVYPHCRQPINCDNIEELVEMGQRFRCEKVRGQCCLFYYRNTEKLSTVRLLDYAFAYNLPVNHRRYSRYLGQSARPPVNGTILQKETERAIAASKVAGFHAAIDAEEFSSQPYEFRTSNL